MTKWRRFEDQIAALLSAYQYRGIRQQVDIPAIVSRRQARRQWRSRQYIATPRFDLRARHPMTNGTRLVECKRYTKPVTRGMVDGFAYRLWLCGIPYSKGLLVVQPRLSAPAVERAWWYGIRVWHDATLERKLALAGLLSPRPSSLVTVPYHSARYVARLLT